MSEPTAPQAPAAGHPVGGARRPHARACSRSSEPQLTLGDLTTRMGMSKATVHRYATALRNAGLLRLTGGFYTLGPRVVELASAALAGLGVMKVAGPYLERLVSQTGQTAVLSVWDGEAPVVVRVDDNTSELVRIIVATGSRLPMDSAQGQVFRAFMEPAGGDPRAGRGAGERGWPITRRSSRASRRWRRRCSRAWRSSPRMALVGTSAAVDRRGPDSPMATALREAAENLSTELGFVEPGGRQT